MTRDVVTLAAGAAIWPFARPPRIVRHRRVSRLFVSGGSGAEN
jgi:hypothetical protein